MKLAGKHVCLLFLLVAGVAAHGLCCKRSVLFIGNSYTYTNNMPLIVQTLASTLGDTLVYDQSDPGGYTLQMHSVYAPTIAKIFSQQWDVVILQEQSELPSFPPDQVDTAVLPYAHLLDSLIHANRACTQTMFLMTWGHANGDPLNCTSYPVICTYQGMQERLRESYMLMTQANLAIVAPVGNAWKAMKDSFPSIWLYIADSSHPNINGSYLESCVVYSSLFHQPVTGCSYIAGLAPADAATIQSVSDKTVFDSLGTWQQWGHYPSAWMQAGCLNDTAHFAVNASIPATYVYQFGDGTVTSDTAAVETHVYPVAGTYSVSVSASDSCFTEVRAYSVNCTGVAREVAVGLPSTRFSVSNITQGVVEFTFTGAINVETVEVFDVHGLRVATYGNVASGYQAHLQPGFYLAKCRGRMGDTAFGVTKFVVN